MPYTVDIKDAAKMFPHFTFVQPLTPSRPWRKPFY